MRQSLIASCIVMVGLGAPQAALAESHRLQPDFTFRRVGVPQSGGGARINVQIDPAVQAARLAPAAPPAAETGEILAAMPAAPAEVTWFWQTISPLLSESGPGRLNQSLRALDAAPAGAEFRGPALQGLADIARTHGRDILRETVGTRVSPALVLAVIAVESGGRVDAVSGAGAEGLMQLMPPTAARFNVTDSMDPVQNIRGGVAYLDWLMGTFDADPVIVLAGYNAGEGSVRTHAGVPPFAETRAYVPKVLAAWNIARGLCVTPPELVTDGCVFAVDGVAR
ncbi:lytic transglycosylase domain-containing protein [Roseisalinus antarcticus]|uniref:Soluble lytic murein transglycosylase n=1 Tax=Roseisalinus antarcticus TaxID=254357 RepID=A0A1Y5SY55_9RHOB|nr:lytic transglycosylase domain-containing protein [Roseisalinus antarcticus]SLN50625.1 Soluble lytic murein transglycosylase precursor [Roseisalinus antarcticus]